jgi:hypothetical protein
MTKKIVILRVVFGSLLKIRVLCKFAGVLKAAVPTLLSDSSKDTDSDALS